MWYAIISPSVGVATGSHFYAEAPSAYPPGEHPCTAAQAADPSAWRWDGAALVPATPTLAQQAAAALASGITITSTSTPSLNGTYPTDDATAQNVMGVLAAMGAGIPLPPEMPWPAKSGPAVLMNTAQFKALAGAVLAFRMALAPLIAGEPGTLPAATATIP